ncbi:hypothetical protein [Deinococcus radiopugnans]|uniref:hypothetical protein n=1 Tax=Deinococcus radiopugnans TaxID=57497 RepID=UPI0012E07874|nr:hypothetical protein [Deinococcus radiopugnans]
MLENEYPICIHAYECASYSDQDCFAGRSGDGHEISVHGTPIADSNLQRLLIETTGCRDISEFKKRLIGNQPVIDCDKSILYLDIHNGIAKYVAITMQLNSVDLDYAGRLQRKLFPSDKVVEHEFFMLEESYRKNGYGSILYQSQEEAWRAAGYERVELLAGKELGGYVWAINGYDYSGPKGASDRTRHIQSIQSDLYNFRGGDYLEQDAYDKLSYAASKLVYPWQVAFFSIPDRVLRREGLSSASLQIGKRALKKYEWSGYKILSDNWHGNYIANQTRIHRIRITDRK